jgi:hypothetical protein
LRPFRNGRDPAHQSPASHYLLTFAFSDMRFADDRAAPREYLFAIRRFHPCCGSFATIRGVSVDKVI